MSTPQEQIAGIVEKLVNVERRITQAELDVRHLTRTAAELSGTLASLSIPAGGTPGMTIGGFMAIAAAVGAAFGTKIAAIVGLK